MLGRKWQLGGSKLRPWSSRSQMAKVSSDGFVMGDHPQTGTIN